MPRFIYKEVIANPTPHEFVVHGTPRTLGYDPNGLLCVWFESGHFETTCRIQWTGEEIEERWQILDTCTVGPLVLHLCAENGVTDYQPLSDAVVQYIIEGASYDHADVLALVHEVKHLRAVLPVCPTCHGKGGTWSAGTSGVIPGTNLPQAVLTPCPAGCVDGKMTPQQAYAIAAAVMDDTLDADRYELATDLLNDLRGVLSDG